MISTRRIAAAVGLAAGIAALAVPSANAADAGTPSVGKFGALTTLDSLAGAGIPASEQDRVPRVTDQLQALDDLKELNQVAQVLAPAAPLLGGDSAVH
ncbi:hypothetical protein D9753_02670 [Streptomyces dangxiongensis]|uniref:Secreted protein n=1 Tax=Streptomyces dangxiongensis TaxID=1442032 RepID=A0A3G2JBY3_9ACTN|nr:hypothetical protein [Streptomyces dangxiongensis]AYN38032.1 hypothetical protein D9753_02670 [Streptomyces dangxiongensis]